METSAQAAWEAAKNRITNYQDNLVTDQERHDDMVKAMYDIANDLTYPTDQEGNQIHIHWLIPMLSAHLAKAGYRKIEEVATIKQIVHPRAGHPGVAEDAVLYVPVDATGAVPKAFIEPPEANPGSIVNEPWRTKTYITVDGETLKGGPR